MSRLLKNLIFTIVSLVPVMCHANFAMTVQPNSGSNQLIIQVSWSSLNGGLVSKSSFSAFNPTTGNLLEEDKWVEVAYVNYELVYDNATNFHNSDIGVGDGFQGVKSYPEGYGVASDDYGNIGDDFYLFRTGEGAIPTSGVVTFVIPVAGQPLANFNIGAESQHLNFILTVTNNPFILPAAELKIKRENQFMLISWNASTPGSLHDSGDLTPSSWVLSQATPSYSQGRFTITHTPTSARRFFVIKER